MPIYTYYPDELYHFGVKGQKWGTRRYQNEDGSYKSGAEGRYNPDSSGGSAKARYKLAKKQAKADYKAANRKLFKQDEKFEIENDRKHSVGGKLTEEGLKRQSDYYKKSDAAYEKNKADYKAAKKAAKEEYRNSDEYKDKVARAKKIAKGAAIVAGTALVAYGAYKLGKAYGKSKLEYEHAISNGRDAYDGFVKLQESGRQKADISARALQTHNNILQRQGGRNDKLDKLLDTYKQYDTNANLDFKNANTNYDIADRYARKAKNTAYYKIHSRLPGQKNRSISDVGARITNGKKPPKVSGLLQDMDMGDTRNADYYRRKLKARGKIK